MKYTGYPQQIHRKSECRINNLQTTQFNGLLAIIDHFGIRGMQVAETEIDALIGLESLAIARSKIKKRRMKTVEKNATKTLAIKLLRINIFRKTLQIRQKCVRVRYAYFKDPQRFTKRSTVSLFSFRSLHPASFRRAHRTTLDND